MKKIAFILFLTASLTLSGQVSQTTINTYCSVAGDDNTGNGTQAAPYRNILKCLQAQGTNLSNIVLNINLLTAGDYNWGNDMATFFANYRLNNSSFNIIGTEELYQDGITLSKVTNTRFSYKMKKVGASWTLGELVGKAIKDGVNFYNVTYNSAGSDSIMIDLVSPTCAGTQIYTMNCVINNTTGNNTFLDFKVEYASVGSYFAFQKCKIVSSQGLLFNQNNLEFRPKFCNFNTSEVIIGDPFIYSTATFTSLDNVFTSTSTTTALDIIKCDKVRLTRNGIVPMVAFSERPLAITNSDNVTIYDLYVKSDVNHPAIQLMKGTTLRWGKCIAARDAKFIFEISQEASIIEDTIQADITYLELINTKAILEKFPTNTVNIQVNQMNLINCADFRHYYDRSTMYVDFQKSIAIHLPNY